MGNPLSDRSDSQFQSIPVISSESEHTRQQFGLSNVAWLPKRPGWAWSTCGQSNSAVQSGQPYSKIEAAAGCVSIPIWMPESFWRGESELKARTRNELGSLK